MKYEFIKRKEDSGEMTYCALPTGSFGEMNVSDTYDSNGQSVGADDAGNWIELKSNKAKNFARKSAKEHDLADRYKKYGVQGGSVEIINAYDFYDIYSDILNSDLVEGEDYIHERIGCKAFNFFDGNNWKSLVVAYDAHEWGVVELVEDEELIAELNAAIDDCEWESESGGYVKYSHPTYNIEKSNWQGNPYSYELSAKDEE